MSPFAVSDDVDGFNAELVRELDRELDCVAEELLTLLELDDAKSINDDSSSSGGRGHGGDHGLPPSSLDEDAHDRELIRMLLDNMEARYSSSGGGHGIVGVVPPPAATAAEVPLTASSSVQGARVARAAKTARRRSRSSGDFSKRHAASHGRGECPRISRPKTAGCLHHQNVHRGSAKRCPTRRRRCSSRRTLSMSVEAEAALRRHPHMSSACGCGYGTKCDARQTEGSGPGDHYDCCGGCGGGTSRTNGGFCGADGRVSSAWGIVSPPMPDSCKCLSLINRFIEAQARGMLLAIAILVPLSIVATTGREGGWSLVLFFAPLVHALVAWAGVAAQASDRATSDRLLLVAKIGVLLLVFTVVYNIVMAVTGPLAKFMEISVQGTHR